jgi:hypothetical protein
MPGGDFYRVVAHFELHLESNFGFEMRYFFKVLLD